MTESKSELLRKMGLTEGTLKYYRDTWFELDQYVRRHRALAEAFRTKRRLTQREMLFMEERALPRINRKLAKKGHPPHENMGNVHRATALAWEFNERQARA